MEGARRQGGAGKTHTHITTITITPLHPPPLTHYFLLFPLFCAQLVFKLAAVPLPEATVESVCGTGLKFAVLKGVDPTAGNYVLAGKMALATQQDGTCLVRLEVNAAQAMCRASVRSNSADLCGHVSKSLAAQLGAP